MLHCVPCVLGDCYLLLLYGGLYEVRTNKKYLLSASVLSRRWTSFGSGGWVGWLEGGSTVCRQRGSGFSGKGQRANGEKLFAADWSRDENVIWNPSWRRGRGELTFGDSVWDGFIDGLRWLKEGKCGLLIAASGKGWEQKRWFTLTIPCAACTLRLLGPRKPFIGSLGDSMPRV